MTPLCCNPGTTNTLLGGVLLTRWELQLLGWTPLCCWTPAGSGVRCRLMLQIVDCHVHNNDSKAVTGNENHESETLTTNSWKQKLKVVRRDVIKVSSVSVSRGQVLSGQLESSIVSVYFTLLGWTWEHRWPLPGAHCPSDTISPYRSAPYGNSKPTERQKRGWTRQSPWRLFLRSRSTHPIQV